MPVNVYRLIVISFSTVYPFISAITVTVPVSLAVSSPSEVIDATPSSETDHLTLPDIFASREIRAETPFLSSLPTPFISPLNGTSKVLENLNRSISAYTVTVPSSVVVRIPSCVIEATALFETDHLTSP